MNENFSTTPQDLLKTLSVDPNKLPYPLAAWPNFAFKTTRHWVRKIEPQNPLDPLLLQILPFKQPPKSTHYVTDPLGDQKNVRPGGIVHRYQNRALWLLTGACSIHCQYCFRQFFPYTTYTKKGLWQQAIDYLKTHQNIDEVILSGGDPLTLSNDQLASILSQLSEIAHIRLIRIHSRQITLSRNRIDQTLLKCFKQCKKIISIVTHVNHPHELDRYSFKQCQLLFQAGVRLFNQSVLLQHINDDPTVLIELSYQLYVQHITPYYLHQLDLVTGSTCFDLPEQRIKTIYHVMQQALPGYLLPKLVKDCAASYKSIYGNLLLD